MNLDSLKITQIILVRFDEIPLNKLIHRPNLERLVRFFEFNNAHVAQDDDGNVAAVILPNGVHKNDSGEYIISRLVLENRRILLEMDGSSKDADAFFASLTSFLADLAGKTEEKYLQPVVKAEESEIIAHLEFPIGKLISPTYLHFVESIVGSEASSDIAEATVKLASLAFDVEYLVKDSSLIDYRVSLSRKKFTVEPRRGYPLADQIYYSRAPFDTNTHIELLEELEKTISQIE